MRTWSLITIVIQLALVAAPTDIRSEPPGAERQAESRRVVEIRSYNLTPGTRDRFHQLFLNEALPMLKRWQVDVIAYGPSLHDQDIVVRLDEATTQGLRNAGGAMTGGAPDDLELLTKLNDDYIQSVQRSDVKRFDEILADDFLCSMADGSLLDRQAFLAQTAKPVTIRDLQAHDVNVRLMGDLAIIHARTSYTTADGAAGGGRYTDVWARRNGKWLAVSAHVTRK